VKIVVKLSGGGPVLSKVVDCNVSLEVAAILADFEHLVLLTKINVLVIAQFLNKEADWGSSGQMEMVDHRLWHHIK